MTIETIPTKKKAEKKKPEIERPWKVILYNDDVHTFEEVIVQLQKATGCSDVEATRITMEAHFKGKAVAFTGDFGDCFRVVSVLREIGLIVELEG